MKEDQGWDTQEAGREDGEGRGKNQEVSETHGHPFAAPGPWLCSSMRLALPQSRAIWTPSHPAALFPWESYLKGSKNPSRLPSLLRAPARQEPVGDKGPYSPQSRGVGGRGAPSDSS